MATAVYHVAFTSPVDFRAFVRMVHTIGAGERKGGAGPFYVPEDKVSKFEALAKCCAVTGMVELSRA